MALITSFDPGQPRRLSLHPTQVPAKYYVQRTDGKVILQIDTHGSAVREIQDKVSQTIQLDEKAARQLHAIIGAEFGL